MFWRIAYADAFDRRWAAATLPIRRRQPEQSVAAKPRTPFRRERDGAPGFRRRSGRIPGLLCIYNAFASARLCRSLLSFAFHLAAPAIALKRGARRERDASIRPQAGTSRVRVCASRVRQNIHPTLRIRTLDARPDGLTRDSSWSGLCRPICADCAASKLHARCLITWTLRTW
jgi:hypothetical protein